MISVFGSHVDKEEIENLSEVIKSQWMGFGKKVDEFEQQLIKKLMLKSFAMVDSGSNALYMAVELLNLPKNSEIILPSFTWVSCAQAIIMAGHKPIFCDVDQKSMNITAEYIKEKISEKTSAIMVVHYAGLPVDLDPIIKLGYPIIEDAAHAICSKYKDIPCGNIGDIGIFSFDAVKNLAVGEGGGITSKNISLIQEAKTLRYCGIGKSGFEAAVKTPTTNNKMWWEYNISKTFIKMLPTNLSASIGLAQLDKIDKFQIRRKYIWDCYQNAFSNIEGIKCPIEANKEDVHSYFTYCIRVRNRDKLAKYLLDKEIYTTLRYHPLHMNKIYNQENVILSNSEKLNKEALSIPLHPRLTDNEVDLIISEIKSFIKNND